MLEIKNLCLKFPEDKIVFENVNFSIEKNTINLITGKSGCGKSSLLMCLSRVIPETVDGVMSGEIIYNGYNIEHSNAEEISGEIAYMFQDPDSQLCTFTVEDEIAFGLENLNVEQEKMEEIIDDILDLVGIKYLKYASLNKLSGGEKQKVALASILALDPDLILMDEPTANLDPISTIQIVELIKKLRDDMGKTIIIIEHNIDDFKDVIDKVIELNDKKTSDLEVDNFIEQYHNNFKYPKRQHTNLGNDTVLDVHNLSYSYDEGKNVIDNVSFSLYKGEIAALVGHNGAGKSTLSKLLIGFIKASKGEILLKEQNIYNMNVKEIGDHMGLVFQNPEHQFIKMTVEKELSLSLEVRGNSEDVVKEKTDNYLKEFNLINNRESNPFTLSQGQKRRLSTASMMINGQPILILDEPTYGQDRENLIKLIDLLYQINKSGTSILIITHDMDMVERCCDKLIYLNKGQVEYCGRDVSKIKNLYFGERIM
ncbi:MAG: energy-coupling factor ABC transporter ATP-binding protein [Clostridioides difficile]|nr:energy-coupling factor ABC transporter ATP-binding protein [Clostridioides difficile]